MKIVLTGGVWQRCQPGAGARAAPPLRVVGALAALVLLAHALVLGTSPGHIEPAPAPATPERVAAMSTRRIALAPPASPTPTPIPMPPALPAPAATPAPPAKPAAVAKPPAATPPQTQPRAQAALKKNPAPAQQAPAPFPDAPAQDEMPQSSADLFTGVEDGSSRDDPATQATPEPPDASSTEPSAAPAATPLAAPPANPNQSASANPNPNPNPNPSSSSSQSPNQSQNQNQNLATALPASVQLDYHITASWLSASGKAELLWHNSASRYDARMTLTLPFGSRSMSSRGQVGAQGLAPSRFADKSRSEVAAHFEPDKGQISFSANTPSVPWVQGAQDRLSMMMQLGGMLAGNPAAFPAGASISVYTVGPRDAQSWTFRVEGEEMLSLPWGELAALKLSRQLRHDDDQKLEVWYAPALGYVPVRNKITQANGDFVDQQLSAVTQP